ncbi:hypothetical protein HMPREF9412_1729 [Paenibacillus sp. HGF5]|nr:hypothetical protein HMPREF9412_1729 [Paenibacillus sp. HGF5]
MLTWNRQMSGAVHDEGTGIARRHLSLEEACFETNRNMEG